MGGGGSFVRAVSFIYALLKRKKKHTCIGAANLPDRRHMKGHFRSEMYGYKSSMLLLKEAVVQIGANILDVRGKCQLRNVPG